MLKRIRKIFTNAGFTLVELMIIVVIISLLASIALFQFRFYHQKSVNAAALTDMRNVKAVLEAYYADHRTYPR